ncbi:MAG TPA: outer membrane lipoprotein-sorting protein [Verrucomicrobiae bacterium]
MKLLPVFIGIILLFNVRAPAQTTNSLSDAEIQGRALAQKILAQSPAENDTNTGTLKIKDANGIRLEIPMECKTLVTATGWQTIYTAQSANKMNSSGMLSVVHERGQSPAYFYTTNLVDDLSTTTSSGNSPLPDAKKTTPFVGSDFSYADLGLEFFHWPQQKVVKREFYRQCSCTVLESTNPRPTPDSYSRVVSWIDNDSLGIVEAYAYDANGKKLKDFYPKDFKKVDGQWQVQTLVMENLQTGSRSRLEFKLKK